MRWPALFLLVSATLITPQAHSQTEQVAITLKLRHCASIDVLDGLDFGDITPSSKKGKVRMTPWGTRKAEGGVSFPGGDYGHPGHIRVTAPPDTRYKLDAPKKVLLYHEDGYPHPMEAKAIHFTTKDGTMEGETLDVGIGGTLEVDANQHPGHYHGSFEVTLEVF